MLTVSDLSIRLPDRLLFDSVSFTVNRRENAGIIGPNGAGKSTLLAVIAGLRAPDSGSVSVPPGTTVGYLRQGMADRPDGVLRDLLDDHLGGLLAASAALDTAAQRMSVESGDAPLEAWEIASENFEALGG